MHILNASLTQCPRNFFLSFFSFFFFYYLKKCFKQEHRFSVKDVFFPVSTLCWVSISPVPIHAGYLGPVFLILVLPWPKIGRPIFRSMLAGRSFASIPDLGPTLAKGWRPMYRVMLPAGLLPVLLILGQPSPKIAGQHIDLCWAACPLPVFLILVQPWPKIS